MCVSPELFKAKLVLYVKRGNPFFVYELASFKPVLSFHRSEKSKTRLYISVNFLILCFVFLSQPGTVLCCWAGQDISCVVQGLIQ